MQRTVPGIGDLFDPLEQCIREDFIPAVIGRKISDLERSIMSLPVRLGGLGISNPSTSSQMEFEASSMITKSLTDIIKNQENTLHNYNKEERIIQNYLFYHSNST